MKVSTPLHEEGSFLHLPVAMERINRSIKNMESVDGLKISLRRSKEVDVGFHQKTYTQNHITGSYSTGHYLVKEIL